MITFGIDMGPNLSNPTNLDLWLDRFPDLEIIEDHVYSKFPTGTCPSREDVFRAFEYFAPEETQVVILGQDPYHSVMSRSDLARSTDQDPIVCKASGLAFGYHRDWTGPLDSSLDNIILEVTRTEGDSGIRFDRTLESWAKQGVLLLNTRLTVEEGKPMSHAGLGWREITQEILKFLYQSTDTIFMLWGRESQIAFDSAVGTSDPARTLRTSHPCKFSAHRGFNGCGHFQLANQLLIARGKEAIKWI